MQTRQDRTYQIGQARQDRSDRADLQAEQDGADRTDQTGQHLNYKICNIKISGTIERRSLVAVAPTPPTLSVEHGPWAVLVFLDFNE